MGHLTLISEDIVSAFDHCPPDLLDILSQYAPQKEWDNYVSGKYKETRDKDTSQLGGGRPVMGLGLAGFPSLSSSRRVDESDEPSGGEASGSNQGRTVEVEQDEGPSTGAVSREEFRLRRLFADAALLSVRQLPRATNQPR